MARLTVKNISKSYEHGNKFIHVLKDVSFELESGDRLGIIGLNGAGKSTLLKILNGNIRATSGQFHVSGTIGSLTDFESLFHGDLSGYQNAINQLNALFIPHKQQSKAIDFVQEFSELKEDFHRPLREYSKGMRLRLSIALLLAAPPQIILLDEVLGAGDIQFQQKLSSYILESLPADTILLFVSHSLNEIQTFCHKSLVLKDGQIAYIGETAETIFWYRKLNKAEHWAKDSSLLKSLEINNIKSDKNEVKAGDSITITFELTIHSNGEVGHPYLILDNNSGPLSYDPDIYSNELPPLQPGDYQYHMELDTSVLNVGHYGLSLLFGKKKMGIVSEFKHVVWFKVIPNEAMVSLNEQIPSQYPIMLKSKRVIQCI
jgi:ABC-type polysaccharide/polyol phosphate transport system ATPase subunit